MESVSCRVQIDKGINGLTIETASPAQPSYSPGETARIHVRLRTPTGAPVMKSIDVPLPPSLAEGDATISIGDSGSNLELEAQMRPYQFTVRSVDELFAALTTLVGEGRSDSMYARLANGKEGLSIGRTPLPSMPPSRRAILAAAGRPETGALADSNVVKLKCDAVVRGTTEVTIHVKKRLP